MLRRSCVTASVIRFSHRSDEERMCFCGQHSSVDKELPGKVVTSRTFSGEGDIFLARQDSGLALNFVRIMQFYGLGPFGVAHIERPTQYK